MFYFCLGACVGSFLSVCLYRIPRRESIIFPRSFCPYCKRSIKIYYNIPIIGYFLSLTRCSFCKTPIPIYYFFLEIFLGLFFYIIALIYTNNWGNFFDYNLFFFLYLLYFCILSFSLSYKEVFIPYFILVISLILSLLYQFLNGNFSWTYLIFDFSLFLIYFFSKHKNSENKLIFFLCFIFSLSLAHNSTFKFLFSLFLIFQIFFLYFGFKKFILLIILFRLILLFFN